MSENPAVQRSLNLIAVLLLAIALIGAVAVGTRLTHSPAERPDPSVRGVLTSGTGSVTATPDQLTFTVTVSNNAPGTASAISRTNVGVRAVRAGLFVVGIAAKDIQTQSISVQPNYDYSATTPRISGYNSTQTLTVLVRKLSTAGTVLSRAATAAGNTVSVGDISMSISDQAKLLTQARAKAMNNSRSSAKALAEAAGRHLGEAVYIEEVTGGAPVVQNLALDALAGAAASSKPIPISPGRQKVTVNVKVRWTLAQ